MDIYKSFHVGDWRVEPSRHILMGPAGEEIRLAPKTIDVLCLLASRHGIVVSRDDILEQVWHSSGAGDDSLNNAISSLRTTFGDDRKNSIYIETISKRGYRLAAAVAISGTDNPPQKDGANEKRQAFSWPRASLAIVGLAIVGVAVVYAGYTQLTNQQKSTSANINTHAQPLTSMPGVERDAQLSPDDSQIVFAHRGDIYLSSVQTREPQKLTDSTKQDAAPIWSPLGDQIAFIRHGTEDCEILIKTIVDGSLRSVGNCAMESFPSLTWHPTGKWLGYAERNHQTGALSLVFVNPTTRERSEQTIASNISAKSNYYYFRFSPGGDKIAFVRNQLGRDQVMQAELIFNDPDNLTTGANSFPSVGSASTIPLSAERISGIDWLTNERLVASLSEQYHSAIWQYRLGDDTAERIVLPSDNPIFPVSSRSGKLIVYSDAQFDMDVWLANSSDGQAFTHRKIIDSTKLDIFPSFSPDGSKIAFISSRTGKQEIWLANSDGSNLRQLTSFASKVTKPIWANDGQTLAFSVSEMHQFDVWTISILDGVQRRLTNTQDNEIATEWRSDDAALVYFSDAEKEFSIRKFELATRSDSLLFPFPGTHAQYTNDNTGSYFLKPGTPDLWLYDFESELTSLSTNELNIFDPDAWTVSKSGVFFIVRSPNGDANVKFIPHGKEVAIDYAVIENARPFHHLSISVDEHANETRFLYSKTDVLEADIVTVGVH